MADFWSFLLQTLTASGAAALLLAVKAMFRDKLSPRWQFAAWGVLALTLVIPAGLGGRYALMNWPFFVEAAKSALTGEFGTITRVTAPVPLPGLRWTGSAADWLYAVYAAGAALLLLRYVCAYSRLRLALRRSTPTDGERVRAVAERYNLPVCRTVEVGGLPSAFVCGVFRPVLALPAGAETDEKVILHELLHLKYRDAAWGLLICFFRCVHWCNPLLWYCANQAGNDLESLCDQRVLERLEGEARRDYGRILLSMANEKYARAPGTSSMSNGGKNIRRRIEAIARFKRYPQGMALVSVCVVMVLAAPLLAGERAAAIEETPPLFLDRPSSVMASARTVRCTTYAGALDAYGKSLLKSYIPYRAMCAPLEEQNALAAAYREVAESGSWEWEASGLPGMARMQSGYQIYNLAPLDGGAYEGLLVVELMEPPEGEELHEERCWLAAQTVRAERQEGRWVVRPQGDFWTVESEWSSLNGHGDYALPAAQTYEARTEDFIIQARCQTCMRIESEGVYVPEHVINWRGASPSFDTAPVPNGDFTSTYYGQEMYAIYTGDPAEKSRYTHIAASGASLRRGQDRPSLQNPGMGNGSGNCTDGGSWGGKPLEEDWESPLFLSGGGAGFASAAGDVPTLPYAYALDLYLNGRLAAELTLLPVERGMEHG